jgi:hypothetical protein
MPRDPNIPEAFDVYTLVLLRRPPDAPEMSEEELDALQARHLAYDLMEWLVAADSLAFPHAPHSVGDRRAMPED